MTNSTTRRAPRALRPAARVARWILNAAAALGVAVVIVAVFAVLFGVRPVIFVSGSMSPAIGTGSLALTVPVAASDIRVGDIVTTSRARDGVLVTHRVTHIERDAESGRWGLQMRGDANKAADSETYDVTAGAARVVWHAEGWGRVVAAANSTWIAVAALALVIIAAWPSRRQPRRSRTTARLRTEPADRAETALRTNTRAGERSSVSAARAATGRAAAGT